MSYFTKRTWVDRVVQYAGRRLLTLVSENVYDVTRAEGNVITAGDMLNATNLNNLETRIEQGFNNVDAAKQDKLQSGTNIKTINGQSVLGSGNLVIEGEPDEYIKSASIDGTGNTLTLTDQDGETLEFTPSGSGGGMTNPMTNPGDIIYGETPDIGTTPPPTPLHIGTAGQVLTVENGKPKWKTPQQGGMENPMTAVGDLIYGSAPDFGDTPVPAPISIGTNGQVLTVDNGLPKWKDSTGGVFG